MPDPEFGVMATRSYNMIVEQEGSDPITIYFGLDVVIQWETIESSTTNLYETVKLFSTAQIPIKLNAKSFGRALPPTSG